MHLNLRLFSLLGIFSLSLISLSGCGEKRIQVATVSGSPGEELILDPITGKLETHSTSGLDNDSIDESALSSQISDVETSSTEPTDSTMGDPPINMAHKPADLSTPADPSASPLESGSSNDHSPIASLGKDQDFSAQSSSTIEDHLNPYSTNMENLQEPSTDQFSQDSSAELQNISSGVDLEPVPETFQIAKAEPSDSLQDRMNRIKNEELAAAAAGLEDIFFQFDSWTLTQEGKQSLQRTLGWFEQDPSSNLIIEGHADQRGTQAYNMVLAKKRAVAVQDYLSQLGIDTTRLAIISYGKDKPFCQDITEVCYQLNRRGHLVIPIQ